MALQIHHKGFNFTYSLTFDVITKYCLYIFLLDGFNFTYNFVHLSSFILIFLILILLLLICHCFPFYAYFSHTKRLFLALSLIFFPLFVGFFMRFILPLSYYWLIYMCYLMQVFFLSFYLQHKIVLILLTKFREKSYYNMSIFCVVIRFLFIWTIRWRIVNAIEKDGICVVSFHYL